MHYYGTRYLVAPGVSWDAECAEYFTSLVDPARDAEEPRQIALDGRYSRSDFLRFATERLGLLLHGSHDGAIGEFQPRASEDYFGNPLTAVYAADDGIWPLFFALINRDDPNLELLWNACEWATDDAGVRSRVYFFAVNQRALTSDALWRKGTIYLLPRDGFRQITDGAGRALAEHVCERAVRPIAKLAVGLDDFPLFEEVSGVDPRDLERHQQVLAAVTNLCEEAGGCTLHIDARRVRLDLVRHVAAFLARFNPGWSVEVAEAGDTMSLSLGFGPGAVAFCTQQIRADLA